MIDVSEHLPLVWRVIGQMHLSANETEEAFSEGLVALAEAGKSYDPAKNDKPANWLAQCVRWSLASWVTSERQRQARHVPTSWVGQDGSEQDEQYSPPRVLEGILKPFSDRSEFQQVVAQMSNALTEEERLVTAALAYGYKGKEVAHALGRSEGYVSDVKHRAREKLQKLRE